MGLIVKLLKYLVEAIFITAFLVIGLSLLPSQLFPSFPLETVSYVVPDLTTNLRGWNNILSTKSDFILKGKIIGPESLVIRNNFLYTGLADGRLIEVDLSHDYKVREVVTRFSDGKVNQSECGAGIWH